MYHRFNENKYPSTNIKIDVFEKQLELIEKNNIEYYDPIKFDTEFEYPKTNKKVLITIDDAFSSFYENAWPILKKKKYHLYYLYQLNRLENQDTWTGIK